MSVEKTVFGTLSDGREAALYTLKNAAGMTLVVTPYGCRIIQLLVPDKDGNLGDVVLGHRTLEEYFGANYQGTFVGRYANRIGGAEFTLNGKTYTLAKNDGNNTLHGGPGGYHQVLWDAQAQDGEEPSITFTHTSPDGDEGYPGTLQMTVTYTLKKDNTLALRYDAVCDQETPFNPTNHSFFNLSGDPQKDVLGTYLVKLSAKHLSVEDNRSVNTLLHTIGDFERVSDHAVNIIKTAQEIRDKDIKFSEEALNDLSVLEAAVQDIVNRTVDAFQKCDTYAAGKIEPLEQVVDGLVREVKTRHIARLQAGVCTIEYGFVLDDLLTNYERIADHCSNIAVAMIEVAADKFDTHEYLNNVKHGGSVKFERRYEKYRGRYTFPPEAYSEPAENPAEN